MLENNFQDKIVEKMYDTNDQCNEVCWKQHKMHRDGKNSIKS